MYLHPILKNFFPKKSSAFDEIMHFQGTCFRMQEGRRTQRIMLGAQAYFIKQHEGIGWREIIKNLLQLRLPVLSAKNEWQALSILQTQSILVPKILGYGCRGWNPAYLKSFLIMESLENTISLEQYCAFWKSEPPSFLKKLILLQEVARIARLMHALGVNHRDFYICHFLLDQSDHAKLYLIDLHRAQIRKKVPKRWRVKDLAGLYFSSKEIGLTQRDRYRFIKFYRQRSLRDIFDTERVLWREVKIRGEKLS